MEVPAALFGGAMYWRLPLLSLEAVEELEEPETVGTSYQMLAEPEACAGAFFWKLPMPELEVEDMEAPEPVEECRAEESRAEAGRGALQVEECREAALPLPGNESSLALRAQPPPPLALDQNDSGEEGSGQEGPSPQHSSLECSAEAASDETERGRETAAHIPLKRFAGTPKSLIWPELQEASRALAAAGWVSDVQARIQKLTDQAGLRSNTDSNAKKGEGVEVERTYPILPADAVERMLQFVWHLDLPGVICVEWSRLVRSRWRNLCIMDWGLQGGGSRRVYLQWQRRWKVLESTLSGLKGRSTIVAGGACGSATRRRLFEALETLVELGAAPDTTAKIPAQLPDLFSAAHDTLLSLLDDESPYIRLQAVRGLADAAGSAELRPILREKIVKRGALIRELLESGDEDLVEAASRMMLNCHGTAPGSPMSVRRRGPLAFTGRPQGTSRASPGGKNKRACPDITSACTMAAWAGVWAGEMRYARGGDRHASLQIVLGLEGDPAVAKAIAAVRAARHAVSDDDEAVSGNGDGNCTPMMRSEGNAEYWRCFGFLPASDFDTAEDAVGYMDEQIRRRQHPTSPAHSGHVGTPGSASGPALVGAGWDDQNGSFIVKADLARTVSAAGWRSPPLAGAIPLRMTLQYETRGSLYELLGFLAEPSSSNNADGKHACALYGVWSITPSFHKHLFAMRRISKLEEPP